MSGFWCAADAGTVVTPLWLFSALLMPVFQKIHRGRDGTGGFFILALMNA